MQKAIQLFEQDFARWGLHIPAADVAARSSGMLSHAGWHVMYDFGRDTRGEFLNYYAALRDGTDPAVTDDWHVRLYETGDRVPLPTVLEAYMYSRDPTAEELARARRKFADPQPPAPAPKPPSPQLASAQPAGVAVMSQSANALDVAADTPGTDIALELGLDLALAGVAPVPGGDTFASWLVTPTVGSPPIAPAMPVTPEATPTPPPKAPAGEDDIAASGRVFVPEPPPARVRDRTAAITADDDTVTISMVDDDEAADDAAAGEQTVDVLFDVADETGDTSGSATEMEGIDHFPMPSRVSSPAAASVAATSDGHAGSMPAAARRHSPPPAAMLTTDIAVVAGSFDPWWYRPTARRIAMVAAAVIAIVIAGSVFTHRSPAASRTPHARADAPIASPAPSAADQSDAADSSARGADTTPDSLPVASAPSSVRPESPNPAAEDGIARPAGPHSLSPIQRSGTSRAPLGSGKTADNSGLAQH
jgi:hypothetical protein